MESPAAPEDDESYAELVNHVYSALLSLDTATPLPPAPQSSSRKALNGAHCTRNIEPGGKTRAWATSPGEEKHPLQPKSDTRSSQLEYLLLDSTNKTLLRLIRIQASIYDDSFPGPSNTYHNKPIEALVERILDWGIRERADMETALRSLCYRCGSWLMRWRSEAVLRK